MVLSLYRRGGSAGPAAGTGATVEGADVSAASGVVKISGSGTTVEGSDTSTGTGSVSLPAGLLAFGFSTSAVTNSGNAVTTTGGTTQVAGSTFVVFTAGTSGSVTSVTDNKGNTYAQKASGNFNGTNQWMTAWVCENGTGGSGHTVTVNYGSTSSNGAAFVEVLNGAGLDVISAVADTSVPSITTTGNDAVLSFTAGPNFTTYTAVSDTFGNILTSSLAGATNGVEFAVGGKIQTSPGSVSDTFTYTPALSPYGQVIVGFKPKVTYKSYGAFNNLGVGGSNPWTATVNYVAGQPIVVGGGDSGTSPSISDTAGLTWNLLANNTANSNTQKLWYAIPPTSGTTTISVSNTTTDFMGGWVLVFTANAGTPTNAVLSSNGATAAATHFSTTITPSAAGNAEFWWYHGGNTPGTPTPDAGTVQLAGWFTAGWQGDYLFAPTTNPVTSTSPVTLGFTSTADFQTYNFISFEVPSAIPTGSSATGSGTTVEGADVSSGTGALGLSGTAAITEGADTSTASGVVTVSGTAAITEGADVSSGSGTAGSTATGTAAFTEGADTSTATGVVTITGTASFTEGADTSAATGAVNVSGTSAITEGADTSTASGVIGVAGTAAITEGADVSSGAGAAGSSAAGTGASVEDPDVSSATGVVTITGTASITEGADTSTATGSVNAAGTAAITEGADTSTASGVVTITGTAAFTEGADTSTGTGTAGSAAVGSGATVEDFDVSAGTGALGVSGTAAITEGFDTSTAAGLVVIVGTGATVEGSDISAGTGSTPIVITSADALLLWQIYKLHGLSSDPLVVTASSRTAGDITQTVSGTTTVTVTTTGNSAALGQGVSTMIQELAALHGISTPLTTTPTTRSAGTINQTLVSANGTVTVTRQ
jgi:hypothetical protein